MASISIVKNQNTKKWDAKIAYKDNRNNSRQTTKRGFLTKREANDWFQTFLATSQFSPNMLFKDFLVMYYDDIKIRIRESTFRTKCYIIDLKILPYFSQFKLSEITPVDVRKWQNDCLLSQGYSQTYIKTINNQLVAILNHAVRYFGLKENPCHKAGSVGKKSADEMNIWTLEEFNKFADSIINKETSWVLFRLLYWSGMRIGELLALEKGDVNFEKGTISISKSYQRIRGRDVITSPKTPRSKRVVSIPVFILEDLQDYFSRIYGLKDEDRIFSCITKSYIEVEMLRGIKASNVKKIRVHDLRHSHASYMIERGASILLIAERLGHEKPETTMNVYSHLYPKKQEEFISVIDKEYEQSLL